MEDKKVKTTVTFLCAVALGLSCMLASTPTYADTPASQFWNGEKQYMVHCASCHGNWGQGIGIFGPPLKGDALVVDAGNDVVAKTILEGRQGPYKLYKNFSGMPEFNFLSVGQVDAIVDYLKNGLQKATAPSKK